MARDKKDLTPSLFGHEDPAPAKPARKKAQKEAQKKRKPKAPRREVVTYTEFAEVALNKPLGDSFTYGIPAEVAGQLELGKRVSVPFGSRREIGVVVSRTDEVPSVPPARLRGIVSVLDPEPVVDEELLALTRWMANEYACSWGEALAAVLPAVLKREGGARKVLMIEAAPVVDPGELAALAERFPKQHRILRTVLEAGAPLELRDLLNRLNVGESPARTLAKKGLVRITKREMIRDMEAAEGPKRLRPEQLTDEQQAALSALELPLRVRASGTYLLQGVTGSGKTEVYLRLIERALEAGRGAIVVVPEIALTPQTVGWFRSRFDGVAVLHSRMTDAQRYAMWMRTKRGEARVVVGARSALFAPVTDLGVIVVDEEHEPSFKQGSTPRYHARDLAIERARLAKAVCVLGTATPSLESWSAARAGKMRLLRLSQRVAARPMPPVDIVDMRSEPLSPVGGRLFSKKLAERLAETLRAKQQSILFLNRRGFTPVLWCFQCQETVTCKHCSFSLTLHRRINRLVCHGCCEEKIVPRACPTCSAPSLRPMGMGAEKVEAALAELLPEARVKRMDSDTMHRREDYEETLEAFGRGELDVLVGTQMIAKGLDFPNVTLVGIVSADTSLHLPDFRAAERTFQLIAQVAGRAGRGELPGRIVVQTWSPTNKAITSAAKHDFDAFAEWEDENRRMTHYPPHTRLLRVVLEDEDEKRVDSLGTTVAEGLRELLGKTELIVLGFAVPPLALVRGRHRRQLLIKSPVGHSDFAKAREYLLQAAAKRGRTRFAIDVDPTSQM